MTDMVKTYFKMISVTKKKRCRIKRSWRDEKDDFMSARNLNV